VRGHIAGRTVEAVSHRVMQPRTQPRTQPHRLEGHSMHHEVRI